MSKEALQFIDDTQPFTKRVFSAGLSNSQAPASFPKPMCSLLLEAMGGLWLDPQIIPRK